MFTLTKKKFFSDTYCCLVDQLGRFQSSSPGMAAYLETVGQPASIFTAGLVFPEDATRLQEQLLDAARSGQLEQGVAPLRWNYPAVSNVGAAALRADVVISFDAGNRQFLLLFLPRLDELPALLQEQKIYRSLLAHIAEAHLFCSMEGQVLYANRQALAVLGLQEIAAETSFEDLIQLQPERADWSLGTELSERGQSRCAAENSRGQALHCNFRLVYDRTGAPMGLALHLENDVARLEAIARAQQLETHLSDVLQRSKTDQDRARVFQQIVESNREAMLFCNLDGDILYGNRAAQKLYGFSGLEELIEKNMGDFYDKKGNVAQKVAEGLRDFGFYSDEFLQYDKNGREMEVLFSCNLVFDDEGRPIGILASNRDVGPQRQAERESTRKTEELLEVRNRFVDELETKVEERTRDLAAEREKTESLLRNILPDATAHELKTTGRTTPRVYEQVSILFTDFKDFTGLTRDLEPEVLITELNHFFTRFDHIVAAHNLEKIKTIGDSYMCAGGLPDENSTHASDAVRAGLAIQEFMQVQNEERRAAGKSPWHLRLGIHTGRVVVGVVGVSKFAYDLWGDAVNVASRVESSGVIDRVNISSDTWELVRDDFDCVERGSIEIKNRGSIPMFFVSGHKRDG